MHLPLLFLLSPAVLAQGYGKSSDPNDEPFLPIYPIYPYSPKLIKRGAERDPVAQLSPELYAPKVDSKDSYSASYITDYPRDPYYPDYNPYPKVSPPSNYAYHGTVPYSYPTAAYVSNAHNSYSSPYVVSPPSYTGIPYGSYSDYRYQPPYYYPNYYDQPPLPPPPLPLLATDYPSGPYSDSEGSDRLKEKKPDGDDGYGGNDSDRFVDGANHLSENSKDLEGRSSSYKGTGLRNQSERSDDQRIKNLPLSVPLPKTTYRVISVAGQPVGPDYPLPAPYAKAQRLEELMSRVWSRLLAQDLQQAARYPEQEANPNQSDRIDQSDRSDHSDHSHRSDQNEQNVRGKDKPRFVSIPGIAKAGLAYIASPSLPRKSKVESTVGQGIQGATTRLKSIEYPPLTPAVYAAIEKGGKNRAEPGRYENYERPSSRPGSQDYDGSSSNAAKQRQNYEDESYPTQNYVTMRTPPGYGYRYDDYDPSRAIVSQQPEEYKNNLEDVNFGVKTKRG